MVTDLVLVDPGSVGTAEATPTKTYTAMAPIAMRVTATAGDRVIRTVPPGTILYPTGRKDGLWWEVAECGLGHQHKANAFSIRILAV